MFSCCVLFCLAKESFCHSFGSNSDRMFHFLEEASALYRRVLLNKCDSSLAPESHDIQTWVELMEDDVMLDPGKAAVSEAELGCYRGRFARSAELYASVESCFYFPKIIGVQVFAVQGLSGSIYPSLASLMPRVFVHGSPEMMVARFMRLFSRLHAKAWMISAELEERILVWFLHGRQLMLTLICWKWSVWYGYGLSGKGCRLSSAFSRVSYSPWGTTSHLSKRESVVTLHVGRSLTAELLVCSSELFPESSVFAI